MVPESEWPYSENIKIWPPVEPSGLDKKAKLYRIPYYQRITTSDECKLALPIHGAVSAGVELTKRWRDAENGYVEIPSEGNEVIGAHSITVIGYDDAKGRFTFANSWGTTWGDKGYGYVPYEALDSRPFEAWVVGVAGWHLPGQPTKGIAELSWFRSDFLDREFHVREFYDADADERIGWAFAVQNEDYLDVEELFVKPQFRRQGYATRLLDSLKALAARKGLPLRFFIPFADSVPEHHSVAERIFLKAGFCVRPSDLPWCSFIASL